VVVATGAAGRARLAVLVDELAHDRVGLAQVRDPLGVAH